MSEIVMESTMKEKPIPKWIQKHITGHLLKYYLRSCHLKIRFANKDKAGFVRDELAKKQTYKRYFSKPLETYLCSFCKGYHIGHITKRNSQAYFDEVKRIRRYMNEKNKALDEIQKAKSKKKVLVIRVLEIWENEGGSYT